MALIRETGIGKAARLVGGQAKLAEKLDVSQASVSRWIIQGYASAKWCRHIEEICEGEVSVYELNPNVFGEPPD